MLRRTLTKGRIASLLVTGAAIGLLVGAVGGAGLVLVSDPDGLGPASAVHRWFATALQRRVTATGVRPDVTAEPAAADWPSYAGGLASRRYSLLRDIDASTVARLRPAWIHEIHDASETMGGTPLAVNGVLYVSFPQGMVVAMDAATGNEIWRYTHKLTGAAIFCCGGNNRGVAAYRDLVYLGTLDAQLLALDAKTGKLRWKVKVADPAAGYSLTMAPLVASGRVIVGTSGAEFGIRGFLAAYDAETGRRVWRFWTIPSPGDGGWWGTWKTTTASGDTLWRDITRERADSAKYPEGWKRGGGSVWITPSYDPQLDLVYAGVGNPWPVHDDVLRPGDNLYTVSVVAVNATTGKLAWYYQIVPHDRWDSDIVGAPILFDFVSGDSIVPALTIATRDGVVFTLDRRHGAALTPPAAFVPQCNRFDPFWADTGRLHTEGTRMHSWSPSALDPTIPALFLQTRNVPYLVRGEPSATAKAEPEVEPEVEEADSEAVDSFGPGVPRPSDKRVFIDSGLVRAVTVTDSGQPTSDRGDCDRRPWGRTTAIDPRSGTIVWERTYRTLTAGSGMLATAGGLVFLSRGTRFEAFDSRTGHREWSFKLGNKVTSPPITYHHLGEQYVLVITGRTLFAFSLAD
jgi:PQQ-dependent dehydrogenase (methanol/ethanol family)